MSLSQNRCAFLRDMHLDAFAGAIEHGRYVWTDAMKNEILPLTLEEVWPGRPRGSEELYRYEKIEYFERGHSRPDDERAGGP